MSTTPNNTTDPDTAQKPDPATPPPIPVSLLEAATFFSADYIALCQEANISLTKLAETLDDPANQPTLEKLGKLKRLEQQRYQEAVTREAIENLRRISLTHPDLTERRRLDLRGRRVLMLGAGGAARGVAFFRPVMQG